MVDPLPHCFGIYNQFVDGETEYIEVIGWMKVIVHACLEGTGELDEDEMDMSGLEAWLREDVRLD